MRSRAANASHGLTATATHDTKRGEDARTRLLALSELAADWARHALEWRELNSGLRTAPQIPSAAHEYMLYQALLGAWPLDGIDATFVDRMQAYAVKAAREAKQETSWLDPTESYENGLTDFVRGLLDRKRSAVFLDSFDAFARRAALIGALKSLTQVVLKSTMPGVPDFYQGTELWDLSLVDPDNRRTVDFHALASALEGGSPDWPTLARDWHNGRIKLALIRKLMALRNEVPELLASGVYQPLAVTGPDKQKFIAFARIASSNAVIVAAALRFRSATKSGRHWPDNQIWKASVDTTGFTDLVNVFEPARRLEQGSELQISQLVDVLPLAVLRARIK
jgi:(1->4)-alpha-D-glucan 1-alpha-D-glucosylmutase